MPSRETVKRARKDARQGKSPSTQAGEFVHEEIRHVREGKHGARSTKAGHRHRSFQSEARRRETAGNEDRVGTHPRQGKTRSGQGSSSPSQDLAHARPRGENGAQARDSAVRVDSGAVAPSARECPPTLGVATISSGAQSRAHERRARAVRRRAQGRSDSRAKPLSRGARSAAANERASRPEVRPRVYARENRSRSRPRTRSQTSCALSEHQEWGAGRLKPRRTDHRYRHASRFHRAHSRRRRARQALPRASPATVRRPRFREAR